MPGQEATIQAAVTAAAAGDTIVVAGGVYRENVVVPIGKDGLVIRSAGAVLDGNLNGVQGVCLTVGSANVVVSGMRFRNGTSQIAATAAGLQVLKCAFSEAGSFAVDVAGDNAVVDGCRFDGPSAVAFRAVGAAATLRHCALRHCGNGGMDATGLNAVADSNTFAWIDDANAVKITGDNSKVTKNKFSLCDRDCIRITGISSLVDGNKADRVSARLVNITAGDGAIVRNNAASYVVGGIIVDGDTTQVLSNRISRCSTNAAIAVSGDNLAVSFNTVTTTWNDSDGLSVDSGSATGGGTVEGNKVTDSAGIGLRFETVFHLVIKTNSAIRCTDDNRAAIRLVGDSNTMTGCTSTAADNVGVYVDGNANALTACSTSGATETGFLIAGGSGNSLTDCNASACELEGLDNKAKLTAVVRGSFRGGRFDVTNDVVNAATFTDPSLAGVSFRTGGSTQQSQF